MAQRMGILEIVEFLLQIRMVFTCSASENNDSIQYLYMQKTKSSFGSRSQQQITKKPSLTLISSSSSTTINDHRPNSKFKFHNLIETPSHKLILILLLNRLSKNRVRKAFKKMLMRKPEGFTISLAKSYPSRLKIYAFFRLFEYQITITQRETVNKIDNINPHSKVLVRDIKKIFCCRQRQALQKIRSYCHWRGLFTDFIQKLIAICLNSNKRENQRLLFDLFRRQITKKRALKNIGALILTKFHSQKHKAFYRLLQWMGYAGFNEIKRQKNILQQQWNQITCLKTQTIYEQKKQLREVKRSFQTSSIQKRNKVREVKSQLNLSKAELKITKKNLNAVLREIQQKNQQNQRKYTKVQEFHQKRKVLGLCSKGQRSFVRKLHQKIHQIPYRLGEQEIDIKYNGFLTDPKAQGFPQNCNEYHLYQNLKLHELIMRYELRGQSQLIDEKEGVCCPIRTQNATLKQMIKTMIKKDLSNKS